MTDAENAPGKDDGAKAETILSVKDLKTQYPIRRGWLRREVGRVRAVDGVDLQIRRGEAIGLVGESGSGKSTLARTLVGLESTTAGQVRFEGRPVSDLQGDAMRRFRRKVQLIVQDPNEAFNPRMKIGEAVAEPLRLHGMDDSDRRRAIVLDLLERVGLSADDADRFPHEFSDGEKQRIALARALVLNPDLIVADEPTSSLDSRVQSDVLALLDDIRRTHGIAVLFISHDLDVVQLFCDRVVVMYLGEFVEKGAIEDVIDSPAHPYTRVLRRSVPSLDPGDRTLARPLTESVPDPAAPPSGCRFHPRCPEIIPPDDLDLSPEAWRAVANLRFSIEADELPEAATASTTDAEASIRDHFGLPQSLDDDDVDRAVRAAISAVESDERDEAASRLADAVPTVCERTDPTLSEYDGRRLACHRYDADVDAPPLEWGRE